MAAHRSKEELFGFRLRGNEVKERRLNFKTTGYEL